MAREVMPSEVSESKTWFDQFAETIAHWVARSWFFVGCVFVVFIWAPTYFFISDINVWQLLINTFTTIVTFLMVALLQNTESRANAALQQKSNALARGLADLSTAICALLEKAHMSEEAADLRKNINELEAAVGVEEWESSDG